MMPSTYTLMITEACNLACAYCYEHSKQARVISTATIDKIRNYVVQDAVDTEEIYIELIGGEPLLAFEQLRYAIDTFHQDLPRAKFSITTNGTCFTPEINAYLEQYSNLISVALSLDGIKECHNQNRCDSFDAVMENFPWWRKHFYHCNVKGTLTPATAKYFADNVKFLYRLGIEHIVITPAFEYAWDRDAADEIGRQLDAVANFMLGLPVSCRPKVRQFEMDLRQMNDGSRPWCGSGCYMLAFDVEGNIYPCLRFITLDRRPPMKVGSVDEGINYNRLRPFHFACLDNMDNDECKACDAAAGCSWCAAYNYDLYGTIFKRSTNNCLLHKEVYRANCRYYDLLKAQE